MAPALFWISAVLSLKIKVLEAALPGLKQSSSYVSQAEKNISGLMVIMHY